MLRGLVREAGGVVALEEGLGVVDAAGEVGDVDAGEGVDFAGVAADGEAVVGVVSNCVGWVGLVLVTETRGFGKGRDSYNFGYFRAAVLRSSAK